MNLFIIESPTWDDVYPASIKGEAIDALESGGVVFFPHLAFALEDHERTFLQPGMVQGAKNVSYNPATAQVRGTRATGADLDGLRALMARFSRTTDRLVRALFPSYDPGLQPGRTSLRPVEISGRVTSWRADDTRLHVDTFPSMPTGGNRILRVFSNINPAGQPRIWKIGGTFEAVARRFHPTLRAPVWGSRAAMYLTGVTKARRSPYDHYMLQLHDRMKADAAYQSQDAQRTQSFPAGSTWIVFTDQVPHAALSGIHQLEQTFYLPVTCLRNEATAPLRVLERVMGRRLT
jgi:hypothetical protein